MANMDKQLIIPPRGYWFGHWPAIIEGSGYWFSKGAMRFFSSRILWGTLTEGRGWDLYFISSEQPPYGARRYTVRIVKRDLSPNIPTAFSIDTVGEFEGYATRAEAVRAMNRAITESLAN